MPTNEALPALESDPIRFGESFDVLPFTVYKRREVDAWKSELAHKFGEVKNGVSPAVPFSVDLLSLDMMFPLFGLVERPRELVAASYL